VPVPRGFGVAAVAVDEEGEGGEEKKAEGDAETEADFGGLG